jgi:hypothetical protein
MTLYSEGQLKQRFALATYYYATNVNGTEPWTQENEWLSYDHHECECYLAPCVDVLEGDIVEDSACDNYTQIHNATQPIHSDDYHFVRLWHRSNNLQGTIPEEIYSVTHLKSVDLNINAGLGGTLSSAIGRWTNLELFSLLLHLLSREGCPRNSLS